MMWDGISLFLGVVIAFAFGVSNLDTVVKDWSYYMGKVYIKDWNGNYYSLPKVPKVTKAKKVIIICGGVLGITMLLYGIWMVAVLTGILDGEMLALSNIVFGLPFSIFGAIVTIDWFVAGIREKSIRSLLMGLLFTGVIAWNTLLVISALTMFQELAMAYHNIFA